jgi:hypothetical protein
MDRLLLQNRFLLADSTITVNRNEVLEHENGTG